MSRKIFILLLVLMSISLIGIVFIQSFFILKNYDDNNTQFTNNVNNVLDGTCEMIEKKEFRTYVNLFSDIIYNESQVDTTAINSLYLINENIDNNETIIYKNGVIEENITFPWLRGVYGDFSGIESENDILIKRLTNQREEKIFSNRNLKNDISPQEFLLKVGKISKSKEILFETAYNDLAKRKTIQERIGSINDFEKLLEANLKKMNIDLDYEYAIFDKDSLTSIVSENYINTNSNFSAKIFKDDNQMSNYTLKLMFPGRTPFLLSSQVSVILTSFIFTLIIVIAYATTILLLVRQQQISQIKTDFINNMTHEFKTPIATINLALSAIKNPKIIGDEKSVNKYLKIIDDENNRMHDQVENVLMISQLERNELNIEKNKIDLNVIIDLAISHVSLLLYNKNGVINLEKNANYFEIIGNESHMINVFVNILDNAIKYNDNQPQIFIKTKNLKNKIVIEVIDNGIGMSKSVQNKIFDKFYRKHTGDLHDVKGHGLGLAYVKKIINFHGGEINVQSLIERGSTFTIKLNTIDNE